MVGLKKQIDKIHIQPPTLLATLASSFMNTLPFPTKFQLSTNLAIVIFDNFVVSVLTSILQ